MKSIARNVQQSVKNVPGLVMRTMAAFSSVKDVEAGTVYRKTAPASYSYQPTKTNYMKLNCWKCVVILSALMGFAGML